METHPVQYKTRYTDEQARLPKSVTLLAYEVYCEVYEPQIAMITGGCRGGFSVGEIIAFLYARSFPKTQWREKVEEVFAGKQNIA